VARRVDRLHRALLDRRAVEQVDQRAQQRVAGEHERRQHDRLDREIGAGAAPTAAEHHKVAAVLRPQTFCPPS
jgi:hypothetical protein